MIENYFPILIVFILASAFVCISLVATHYFGPRVKNAVKDTQEAKGILDSFSHIDILMCHQPPKEVLDIVKNPGAPKHWQGKHAGSETILKYINEFKPKYVLCGHIHEGRGEDKIGESNVYNLGCCGDKIIEIDD